MTTNNASFLQQASKAFFNSDLNKFHAQGPDGSYILSGETEKEAYKLLGAKSKKDRDLLSRVGFKIIPNN